MLSTQPAKAVLPPTPLALDFAASTHAAHAAPINCGRGRDGQGLKQNKAISISTAAGSGTDGGRQQTTNAAARSYVGRQWQKLTSMIFLLLY